MERDEEREGFEAVAGDEGEESIFDPGQKFEFWKPEVAGQELRGRLVRVKELGLYGPTLRLATPDGRMAVSLTEQLADVDWKPLVGRTLIFRFLGWIETKKKGYKMRNIKVSALRDEIPF
jgi:hypothetical protein